MKNLVLSFSCLLASILMYSCGELAQKETQDLAQETFEHNGQTYKLKKNISVTTSQKPVEKEERSIIFHEMKDAQRNMAMGYLPLPSNWKIKDQVGNDGIGITGPNNIKAYMPKFDNFVYSQLSGFNQMIAEMGQQVKPLKNVEQLVKEEFLPLFANNGYKLIDQYRLPKQKAYDENYEQFVFKPVPMQKTFDVMATEWEDNDGNMMLFVIRQNIAYTQEACYWGYLLNILEAPKTQFEAAKNNYLYTLANSKYNPKWLHARYMEDAQTSARMGKLHQERMRQLRAEGDAIIQRGKAHSAMVDRNHKRFIDTQLERQTVSTGSTNHQVDAGSKEYWMNSSNEYISSDDLFYDPNTDNSVNNETWTKMTIQN